MYAERKCLLHAGTGCMDTGVSDKNANLQANTNTDGVIQTDENLHRKIQPKG